jgi:hypothetical protein
MDDRPPSDPPPLPRRCANESDSTIANEAAATIAICILLEIDMLPPLAFRCFSMEFRWSLAPRRFRMLSA